MSEPALDPLVGQTTRLRILAALVSLEEGEQLDFMDLLALLELTAGNMGAHLQKLEEAGYVHIEKTFVGRRPKTWLGATDRGRRAFADHVDALEAIARREERKNPPMRSKTNE